MQVTALISGCGLDRDTARSLPEVWERFARHEIGPALHASYAFCKSSPELTDFLWGQAEQEWVSGQKTRWEEVFRKGIDEGHVAKVREFARGDLENNVAPAIYGQFFSCLSRELASRILASGTNDEQSRKAAILVNTLMNAEATIASSAYSEAQSEKSLATVEELTGMMGNNVGTIIGGVVEASEKLSSSMSTIRENVGRNLNLATDISETVDSADGKLADLSTAIDSIRKLLDGIRAIAGQTNMLALNATIEAARAGDAGLGFAVVAREVKMLATDSREAADSITEMTTRLSDTLDIIQSSFQDIATRVSNMVQSIEASGSATEEQQRATDDIAERMARLDNEIGEAVKGIRHHYAA